MVASQSQSGITNTFQLDAALRQRQRIQTGGSLEGTEIFHFAGETDSPAWTERGTTWTRYITGIGGELAAIQESGKEAVLQRTDLHGDVVVGLGAAIRHPEIDAVGIITRSVAIFSVGALAGRYSDRMRAQAALHAELELARGRIAEQFRSAHRLLDHQEEERHEVAQLLHEQVAQPVAAALVALSLIQRDSGVGRLSPSEIEALRLHMRNCLDDLRGIANSLRPAVLAELGLLPALERLCVEEGKRIQGPIVLHTGENLADLPPGVEIAAYRTVEEALQVLNGVSEVSAQMDEGREWLTVAVSSPSGEGDRLSVDEQLTTTRARLDLLGGTLEVTKEAPHRAVELAVVANIPLRQD